MTTVMVLLSIWQVIGNVVAAIATYEVLFGKACMCLVKNNFVSKALEQIIFKAVR